MDNRFFASQAAGLISKRAEIRREFGLPADAFVPLFVGRFIDRKCPDVFVKAVAAAAESAPRMVGLMVGDGAMKAETTAWVESHHAPIRMTGFLNQGAITRAYVAADILVVPSTWETWGLVVNEAMACGLPAAVTDGVACAGDLVQDGVTGVVVPVGSVDALARELSRLAGDGTTVERLGAAARTLVGQFDVNAAVAGTLRAIAAVGRASRKRVAHAAADAPAQPTGSLQ